MHATSGAASPRSHQVPRRAFSLLRHVGFISIPFLLAAAPLLSLYSDNQTEVELGALWWPLFLLALISAGLYGLLWLILRDGPKACVLASLVTVWFHFYGDYNWALWAWTLLFVALGALVVLRGRPRFLGPVTLGLAIWSVVLVVSPTSTIVRYERDNPSVSSSDPNVWPTSLPTPNVPIGARKPDIYVLCPDDYARHDVLAHYFGYDNGPFLRQLERRGFVVSPESRSPYSDSEENIAAETNMDDLSRLPHILGPKSEDSRPVRRLIQDNRASRILKELGYRYVHIDTDEVTWGGRNPQISRVATPDSFMSLWLADRTVLKQVGGWPGFNQSAVDERFRDTIRSQFASLGEVPLQPGPKFVLFHTLMPHDPYIFGAHGQAVTFHDKTGEDHTRRIGMRYYAQQIRYTETLLLRAIDAIQSKSKQPPVILLQADEGFEGNDTDLGEAVVRDIRVKGISAAALPGMPGARLPDKLNTVNTLRYVINRYFDAGYPMLPNKSYPEGDLPYQFEEMKVRGLAPSAP
jgi:hypothetical protein